MSMTQEECRQALAEAEKAYKKVLTGRQVVELWHGDQRTRYSAANATALAQYIERLKSQCGNCRNRGRSVGMIF